MEEIIAQRPRISIVVPVYNAMPYLKACLESAVGQTLRQIEILCVDDASTDDSAALIAEYCARDARVRLIRLGENSSSFVSRKAGVSAASGEYIMMLDADDDLEKDACRILLDEMERDPADILHYRAAAYIASGKTGEPICRSGDIERVIAPYEGRLAGRDVFEKCFVDRWYSFTVWNKIYRAAFLKRVYESLPDRVLPRAEDMYLYFAISYYAESYRGLSGQRPLYTYYFGRGSGKPRVNIRQFEGYCKTVWTSDAIGEFARATGEERVQTAAGLARDRLFEDCIQSWHRTLDDGEREAGLRLMLSYWDKEEVLRGLNRLLVAERDTIRVLLHQNTPLAEGCPGAEERVLHLFSYKLGCALTWPARKLNRAIRRIRGLG